MTTLATVETPRQMKRNAALAAAEQAIREEAEQAVWVDEEGEVHGGRVLFTLDGDAVGGFYLDRDVCTGGTVFVDGAGDVDWELTIRRVKREGRTLRIRGEVTV